jgi:hypothetical protein
VNRILCSLLVATLPFSSVLAAAYEGPDDVHVVGRNASSTKPAKFLVVLIKDKGAPALVPVE